ncbi:alpha/beta hydrolase-fold protein [Sphingobacterium oryzagri]|uniref:Alpha/beta hydrolase-fold protein n=1 Tax=Sphingobacterium oryzagri TaxID=3025669 RepID=A0ABY7WQM5_9SPHI|nr:alpha/beta hydrolase-fold protein [Sphingobacterium sp. KACC 22765]WDF69629.1 alpha/beta hydrolase-fold protein [Sphingobacterium sp. KACC 22765]
MKKILILLLAVFSFPAAVQGQFRIIGHVLDSEGKAPLSYVNIGIKNKNLGTVSSLDGVFELDIPVAHQKDTLTFSLVGYAAYHVAIQELKSDAVLNISLKRSNNVLENVVVEGKPRKEERFGIKRRGRLIHFADGMFNPHDSFEIGQLIKLGKNPILLSALNLYLLEPRDDSATFRINFYRFKDGQPSERLVEKSIIQRKAIAKGWLRFDLAEEHIYLSGDVIAAVEFLPDVADNKKPISYEVKLGGASKSFYRRNSLGTWNMSPHHYCLHVTALVDPDAAAAPEEDRESSPAFTFASTIVGDRFHIFVGLPKDYERETTKKYPVLFLLDGNAYFDQVNEILASSGKKHQQFTTTIVVGIGYENAYLMDSLRVRDYTYPKAAAADSLATSGGADKFYDFITQELSPYLDSCYRTDTSARTIMGHSFGAYFALYALLKDWRVNSGERTGFSNYVAASPPIGYHENYIVEALKKGLENAPATAKKQNLYMTMGERELNDETKQLFEKIEMILNTKGSLLLQSKIYRNTDHLGTAVPSFKDAIEVLYKSK